MKENKFGFFRSGFLRSGDYLRKRDDYDGGASFGGGRDDEGDYEDDDQPLDDWNDAPADDYDADAYDDAGDYGDAGDYEDGYADPSEDAYDASAPIYDDDDEDPEVLGYNPDIFKNLDNDSYSRGNDYQGEYEDEGYQEGEYEDEGYDDDSQSTEYDGDFEDGDYADDEFADEPKPQGGVIEYLDNHSWVMWLTLIIFPPIGIWLLWRSNKFHITLRYALSIISIIIFILLIVLLASLGGKDDPTDNPNWSINATPPINTVASPTPTASATATATATPTSTPRVTHQPDANATNALTYVWATQTGINYHTLENCGDISNASKITLDTAVTRGLSACPDCAGGAQNEGGVGTSPVGKTLYANPDGKWYHVNPTCQGMKNAQVVNEASAIAAKKVACPECIGYYGRPDGENYHNISNCRKMQNAVTNTKEYWEGIGLTACATCIGGGSTKASSTATEVYFTDTGTWFHTKSNCTGMNGARLATVTSAVNAGKKICPKCVKPDNIYVFATQGGDYFHTYSTCTGMKNAVRVTAKTAMEYGKPACPKCASMFATSTDAVIQNSAGGTTSVAGTSGVSATSTLVYANVDGTWFHAKSDCTGMKNAKQVTIAQAASAGKKMCTKCINQNTLAVFCVDGGENYHTLSNCRGMKNAKAMTAKAAIDSGHTACRTCTNMLTTSSPSSPTGGTNNPTGGTSGPAGGTVTNPTIGLANSTVYIVIGAGASNNYHIAAKCSSTGVSGAQNVTLEYALSHSYTACPYCKPPSKISS